MFQIGDLVANSEQPLINHNKLHRRSRTSRPLIYKWKNLRLTYRGWLRHKIDFHFFSPLFWIDAGCKQHVYWSLLNVMSTSEALRREKKEKRSSTHIGMNTTGPPDGKEFPLLIFFKALLHWLDCLLLSAANFTFVTSSGQNLFPARIPFELGRPV